MTAFFLSQKHQYNRVTYSLQVCNNNIINFLHHTCAQFFRNYCKLLINLFCNVPISGQCCLQTNARGNRLFLFWHLFKVYFRNFN